MQEGEPTEDVSEEVKKLLEVNHQYLERHARYEQLYTQHNRTTLDMQLKHQALDAFKETLQVFQEQLEIHRRSTNETVGNEKQK